ncbi:MAG: hypothetical protein ABL875_06715, partial [Candidatus Nitrotoga sp.]
KLISNRHQIICSATSVNTGLHAVDTQFNRTLVNQYTSNCLNIILWFMAYILLFELVVKMLACLPVFFKSSFRRSITVSIYKCTPGILKVDEIVMPVTMPKVIV